MKKKNTKEFSLQNKYQNAISETKENTNSYEICDSAAYNWIMK